MTSKDALTIEAMSKRDEYRDALARIRSEPHGHPGRADDPLRPVEPQFCPICSLVDSLIPPMEAPPRAMPLGLDGRIREPHPCAGERWIDRLVLPPDELQPYDRLTDGRYIISLSGPSQGRWTTMDVAHLEARWEVVEIVGQEEGQCLWGIGFITAPETIPVPSEVAVFRSDGMSAMTGYTCTAPGDPDVCTTCPARLDRRMAAP